MPAVVDPDLSPLVVPTGWDAGRDADDRYKAPRAYDFEPRAADAGLFAAEGVSLREAGQTGVVLLAQGGDWYPKG